MDHDDDETAEPTEIPVDDEELEEVDPLDEPKADPFAVEEDDKWA